jgi:hypothetical protein
MMLDMEKRELLEQYRKKMEEQMEEQRKRQFFSMNL